MTASKALKRLAKCLSRSDDYSICLSSGVGYRFDAVIVFLEGSPGTESQVVAQMDDEKLPKLICKAIKALNKDKKTRK